jgi:hypothetical protein
MMPAMSWREIDLARIDRLASVPAMLGGDERRFLYSLGRDVWSGAGEILDLGAFLGGSAACLAAGVRDGPVQDKAARVHSYDWFRFWTPAHRPFLPDFAGGDGDDVLPVYRVTTEPYREIVTATAGDICAQPWDRPVEILFLDFTQSPAQHDAVTRTFYPHLLPGAMLVHQDYVYVICWWLHVWMEKHSRYFEVVEPFVPNGTAAWRLTSPLPAAALAPLHTQLSTAEMYALMDHSLERYRPRFTGSDEVFFLLLRCARCRLTLDLVGPEAARREIAALPADEPHVALLIRKIEDVARSRSAL